jgi:predicted dehydrogenase
LKQSRRRFLQTSGALIASVLAGPAAEAKIYRAAIIGRTGGGDYGHGFDTIFAELQNVTVEALADSNPAGLEAAAKRSGAKRKYADYREMLQKEHPDLVSIAPRQPDCHRAMALEAIAMGAHLIVEKPFTEHLNEADEIVAAAEAKNLKILVGHKNRFSSDFVRMQRLIREGFLGTVLEMRVQGKQDGRAGGEDLIVLGTHDFDTMRFFFGDPLWCFGTVMVQGRPAKKSDARQGREPILVAGDTIRAQFQFPNNVLCSWQSVTADKEWNTVPRAKERWGFTIFGTKRILSYYSLAGPLFVDTPFLGHKTEPKEWQPLPDPKEWPPPAHETHLVKNLIHSIEHDRQPLCSGRDGRWTIEMVSAVYESHRTRSQVEFPLKDRTNPLTRL